jgi:RNA polymerase sigma factor (sigma-70 family)
MATAPPRPDAVLARRLRERDRTAWEELYHAYEGRLYGFAYRLAGNPHDAADLVQETFVRALPRLDRLDPDRLDLQAYLFATLKNLFLKGVERRKRAEPVEEVPEPGGPAAIEDDPERSALLARQQAEVRLANARLNPRQRLVLALRELEDRSYAEIGEIVGLNENAVAQLVFRARESLRTELRLVQVDRSQLPAECQENLPSLAAYLDGQLRGAKAERVLAHLEACEACQQALADMREASRRYRALVPPVVGLVALRERVDGALAASGYWRGVRLGIRHRPRLVMAAGAASVAILGGVGAGVAVVAAGDDGGPRASALVVTSVADSAPAAPPPAAVPAATAAETEPAAGETAPAATGPATSTAEPGTTEEAEAAGNGAEPPPEPAAEPPAPPLAAEPPPEPPPTTSAAGPPTVTITSAPAGEVASTGATIRFRASAGGVTFACRLDAAAWAPCSSPVLYAGLAPGAHTFRVRAGGADGVTGPAAVASWVVVVPDAEAPTVTFTEAPPPETSETEARFAFVANEEGVAFECRLDGAAFSPCTTPVTYTGLPPGAHTFAVRATDAAGNAGAAADVSWTVLDSVPDLVIGSLTAFSVTVVNAGTGAAGASVLTVSVPGGTFTVPSLAPGASATFSWSSCVDGKIAAVADARKTVAESNEANNTASIGNLC